MTITSPVLPLPPISLGDALAVAGASARRCCPSYSLTLRTAPHWEGSPTAASRVPLRVAVNERAAASAAVWASRRCVSGVSGVIGGGSFAGCPPHGGAPPACTPRPRSAPAG